MKKLDPPKVSDDEVGNNDVTYRRRVSLYKGARRRTVPIGVSKVL